LSNSCSPVGFSFSQSDEYLFLRRSLVHLFFSLRTNSFPGKCTSPSPYNFTPGGVPQGVDACFFLFPADVINFAPVPLDGSHCRMQHPAEGLESTSFFAQNFVFPPDGLQEPSRHPQSFTFPTTFQEFEIFLVALVSPFAVDGVRAIFAPLVMLPF